MLAQRLRRWSNSGTTLGPVIVYRVFWGLLNKHDIYTLVQCGANLLDLRSFPILALIIIIISSKLRFYEVHVYPSSSLIITCSRTSSNMAWKKIICRFITQNGQFIAIYHILRSCGRDDFWSFSCILLQFVLRVDNNHLSDKFKNGWGKMADLSHTNGRLIKFYVLVGAIASNVFHILYPAQICPTCW